MEIEKRVSLPLTWSWLAGFVQAEGTISVRRVTISQAYGDALDLIRDFLGAEIPMLHDLHVSKVYNDGTSKYGRALSHRQLSVYNGYVDVMYSLLPYLRYAKRERTIKCLKLEDNDAIVQSPFDDDWIVGFWEGDGWIQLSTSCTLGFAQINVQLLTDIKDYLDIGGSIHGAQLCIPITKTRIARIGKLLSRVRSSSRLEQLSNLGI